MSANSVAKIGVGAPMSTGGVMYAALGTTLPLLPSAATTDFTKLGLVDENGVVPSGTRKTTDILDWAGDVIASPQDEHSSMFKFKLYQAFDADVLSVVFGPDQVSQSGSIISVNENGEPLDPFAWLFDVRDKGGKRVRICVPVGQVTDISEDPFVRNKLQAFEITLNCFKDDSGNKVYRRYDDGSAASAPVISSRIPASGTFATAGGDNLVLIGNYFVGTTAVTVGGTNATDFTVINDQSIAITMPAKTAAAHNIVVTNATGASAGFSVTYA